MNIQRFIVLQSNENHLEYAAAAKLLSPEELLKVISTYSMFFTKEEVSFNVTMVPSGDNNAYWLACLNVHFSDDLVRRVKDSFNLYAICDLKILDFFLH